ncbi:hypothetical protein MAR_014670 [Mya arenaria]|uniref:Uncharacterized protein n=1 Tax=Mya arenaria TaxID=6604 RepID=A0ABY7FNA8_MYAAR|nr:hypothetical protein MAR_014670 [Mya arenaria]
MDDPEVTFKRPDNHIQIDNNVDVPHDDQYDSDDSNTISVRSNEGAGDGVVVQSTLSSLQSQMQTLENKLCNDEVTRPGGVRARDVERHNREIGRGRTPTLTSYREDAYNHLGKRDFVTNSGTATFKTKPQTYDGTKDLDEYVTHFNIVSDINGWTYPVKSLMLASSMKGPCLSLLNDLKKRLWEFVGSFAKPVWDAEQSRNLQSKATKQKGRNETISEMALAIRNLTRKAYPSASTQVIKLLALEYFIDALPDADIRLRLREVGQKSIGEAEQITVRLEAHKVADRSRGKHSVRSLEPNEDPASNSFGRLSSQLGEVIGQLKRIRELQIENVNLKMVTATGEVAPFFGKFKANQGSKQYCHDVYIADIKNDGILGMDFFS